MRKRLAGCAVLALSCLLALVAAEGLLRFLSAHWLHVLDVEMWRYARFVKTPSKIPGAIEEHQPNADEWLMGKRVRTDERGFRRNAPEVEAARTPNDRLVMAVGDSLTFGWGAGESDTWPNQLEELLRQRGAPSRVMNFGIGNSNTSMQLARYRSLARNPKPAWVILGFFINDAEPDPKPSESTLVWRSALAGLLSTRLRQSSEVKLRDYKAYYRSLYNDDQPGWIRMKQALAELGALLRQDGVPHTLLLLPELHQPKNFGSFADIYAKVADAGRASGWEVIDPSGRFPANAGPEYWATLGDAHPNRKAQRIFAEALLGSRYALPGR